VLFMLTMTLLGAATLGSVVAYQRAERARVLGAGGTQGLLAAAPVERTPATLGPGDVVLDGGEDWLVTASVTYVEETERWWRHHLEDGHKQSHLEVHKRDGFVVGFVTLVDDVPLHGQLMDGLTYRGQTFRLERRGTAQRSTRGMGDELPPLVQYAHYATIGEHILVVEEDRAGRRAFYGRRVPLGTLSLMPGEDPESPMETMSPLGRRSQKSAFDDDG
jgi:hypothetical protein